MSMLSFQCDELRKAADELQALIDNGHNYTWSGFFSTLHYAQQGLRGAADTIWELRCKLVDVVDQQDEIELLKTENEKLRKLCAELCLTPDDDVPKLRELFVRAIELGIEVEDDGWIGTVDDA